MSDEPPPLPMSPLPAALIPRPGVVPMTDEREAELRAALISEALSWVGTPYRQLGATKGVSVDCSMLLVRALVDSGLVEPFDPRPYPPAWFLHRKDERYIEWLSTIAVEVSEPKPGDIIAMKMGRAFAHSGFIVYDGHLVHAFADEGYCNVTQLSHPMIQYADRYSITPRPKRYFDVFAKLRADHPA